MEEFQWCYNGRATAEEEPPPRRSKLYQPRSILLLQEVTIQLPSPIGDRKNFLRPGAGLTGSDDLVNLVTLAK